MLRKVAFEPVPRHVKHLMDRFRERECVEVRPYGLWSAACTRRLYLAGDRTSAHLGPDKGPPLECVFHDVAEEVDIETARNIQMQLNVEGDEYAILTRLLDAGKIYRVQALQVQFHNMLPGHVEARDEIIGRLRETHKEEKGHAWVWERFTRK